MHKRLMLVLGVAIFMTSSRTAPAGDFADAGKYTIHILMDRNYDAATPPKQVEQYNQVLNWMGPDLVRVLEGRGGYKTSVLKGRDEFKAGDQDYLLTVKIVKYKAGSKAARMVVGYGAGSTSLDIHYELIGNGKDPLLAKDDGVGSSREWFNCCRKLNENMLAALNAKFKSP